ncbi:MAG: AraC family transcriptional regulator [Rhodobacteraceae bacterium]|nr:AraC family transcriptional regulator [Paracoccaceae bacterium]
MTIERQTIEFRRGESPSFRSILFSETRALTLDDGEGRVRTEQTRLGPSGIRFSRVRSTGHLISLVEDRDATFLFPRAGSAQVTIGRSDCRVDEGGGALVRPHARTTRVRAGRNRPYEGHVLMLPAATIAELAGLRGAGLLHERDVTALQGRAAQRLSDYLAFLVADLDRAGDAGPSEQTARSVTALLRDLIADWIGEGTEAVDGVREPTADALRVRRAIEILRARSDEPISIVDLAGEVGVGVRSLQLAFQNVLGEGPRARLTRIRLERARERLLAADRSGEVTAIALECGFTHLSRFADIYLRTYGERPSETLGRRRRTSTGR